MCTCKHYNDEFEFNLEKEKQTPRFSAGHRAEFLLPDRSKYVNMEKRFLRSYMELLVQTCHRRGAPATGGMAALLLPTHTDSAVYTTVLNTVTRQETADLLLN